MRDTIPIEELIAPEWQLTGIHFYTGGHVIFSACTYEPIRGLCDLPPQEMTFMLMPNGNLVVNYDYEGGKSAVVTMSLVTQIHQEFKLKTRAKGHSFSITWIYSAVRLIYQGGDVHASWGNHADKSELAMHLRAGTYHSYATWRDTDMPYQFVVDAPRLRPLLIGDDLGFLNTTQWHAIDFPGDALTVVTESPTHAVIDSGMIVPVKFGAQPHIIDTSFDGDYECWLRPVEHSAGAYTRRPARLMVRRGYVIGVYVNGKLPLPPVAAMIDWD